MRLNHKLLPMIDYHKAKELMWDPRQVDCAQDRRDWTAMSAEERDLILRVGRCSTRARKPWRTIWPRCWWPCAARAATPKTSSSWRRKSSKRPSTWNSSIAGLTKW